MHIQMLNVQYLILFLGIFYTLPLLRHKKSVK